MKRSGKIEIEFDEKNQAITQHDLDLLIEISAKFGYAIKFKNVNFNGLSFNDKIGYCLIFEDCDLRQCEFQDCEREYMSFSSCIVGENFSEKLKQMRNLKTIGLNNQEGIDIGELKNLEEVKLYGTKNLNILKECKHIKVLGIFGDGKKVKEIELLKELKQLQTLYITDMRNVQKNLPESPNLENLQLNYCGFSNIEYLEKYEKLQRVNLDNNDITTSSLEKLKKLSTRWKVLSFAKNPLADFLQKQIVRIRDKELQEVFKRYNENAISKYDFVAKKEKYEIDNVKTLEKIVKMELSKCMVNTDFKITIDDFESMSIKALELISQCNSEICIESFKGLNPDILNILGRNKKIKFYLEGDEYTSTKGNNYTFKDMQEILNVMETIKKSIDEKSTELEKFLAVYKSIGMIADYDHSGCESNENYTEERGDITRSIKGTLIDGTAVCVGYALALKYSLDYMGIESKIIRGKRHAWNQVKIDGKWYNCDLTWDYTDIREKMMPEYCLIKDKPFYLSHKKDRKKKQPIEQCDEDYPREQIGEVLRELQTDFDIHQNNLKREETNKVKRQDYENIANSTTISTTIFSRIKAILKKSINYDKNKQEEIEEEVEDEIL